MPGRTQFPAALFSFYELKHLFSIWFLLLFLWLLVQLQKIKPLHQLLQFPWLPTIQENSATAKWDNKDKEISDFPEAVTWSNGGQRRPSARGTREHARRTWVGKDAREDVELVALETQSERDEVSSDYLLLSSYSISSFTHLFCFHLYTSLGCHIVNFGSNGVRNSWDISGCLLQGGYIHVMLSAIGKWAQSLVLWMLSCFESWVFVFMGGRSLVWTWWFFLSFWVFLFYGEDFVAAVSGRGRLSVWSSEERWDTGVGVGSLIAEGYRAAETFQKERIVWLKDGVKLEGILLREIGGALLS